MTNHILKATTETVHLGGFSNLLPPVLTVDRGDTIDLETCTGYYVYEKAPPQFLTPEFLNICENLPPEGQVAGGSHLLMAETPTDITTMGYASTLDAALEIALKNMIDFLERLANLSPEDAYVLCSLAVSFHISQVVNSPHKGVHGMSPKSIISNHINL